MPRDISKSNVLPDSVDNAITNLTDLPTKGIGQTLSDCWFLAFGGISQLAEKKRAKYVVELEKFKKELEESLKTVPECYQKEPTSQMILKTLNEAKYCVEETELRELFISLLTSATNSQKNVHPSFAQIIGQMSSNDAKMIKIFMVRDMYPICDLKLVIEDNSYQILKKNIFIDGPQIMNLHEKMISISSLVHLGLLEIPADSHFTDNTIYLRFEETTIYKGEKAKYPDGKIKLEKKIVTLTELGRLFILCCVPN